MRWVVVALSVSLFACANTAPSLHPDPVASPLSPEWAQAWLDWRFHGVTPQRFSTSCGAAALSTVLSFHCGLPISEQALLKEIADNRLLAGRSTDFSRGINMLDIVKALRRRGYQPEGLAGDLRAYVSEGRPVIALVKRRGFMHFTVVIRASGGRIWLADSMDGNTHMSWSEFQAIRPKEAYFVAFGKPCINS